MGCDNVGSPECLVMTVLIKQLKCLKEAIEIVFYRQDNSYISRDSAIILLLVALVRHAQLDVMSVTVSY